jgi:hypothetical protein
VSGVFFFEVGEAALDAVEDFAVGVVAFFEDACEPVEAGLGVGEGVVRGGGFAVVGVGGLVSGAGDGLLGEVDAVGAEDVGVEELGEAGE